MTYFRYDPIFGLVSWKISGPERTKVRRRGRYVSRIIESLRAHSKMRTRRIRNFRKNVCNSEFKYKKAS